MLLRNYDQEETNREKNRIDIIASTPESEESILLRVVTPPKSGYSKVGVGQVKKMEEELEREEIDKVIMFGNDFTYSAMEELFEEGIEFYSENKETFSDLNPKDMYLKIINCVLPLTFFLFLILKPFANYYIKITVLSYFIFNTYLFVITS